MLLIRSHRWGTCAHADAGATHLHGHIIGPRQAFRALRLPIHDEACLALHAAAALAYPGHDDCATPATRTVASCDCQRDPQQQHTEETRKNRAEESSPDVMTPHEQGSFSAKLTAETSKKLRPWKLSHTSPCPDARTCSMKQHPGTCTYKLLATKLTPRTSCINMFYRIPLPLLYTKSLNNHLPCHQPIHPSTLLESLR